LNCNAVLFFAIVHWSHMSSYLLPTILYYVACTTPTIVQMAASYFIDGGSCLLETKFLAKSGGCAEMILPKDRFGASVVENAESGLYVRICVPEISLMWHPFTVASTDPTNLKILFRKYGTFTTKLYKRLREVGDADGIGMGFENEDAIQINRRNKSSAPSTRLPPIILVDAYYGGGVDWATRVLEHDNVLLVAGGIGVTPFLSLLSLLHQSIVNCPGSKSLSTKHVEFHWYSRDEGLIRHVLENHFSLLANLQRNKGEMIGSEEILDTSTLDECDSENCSDGMCHFEIVVHFTALEVDEENPFCGASVNGHNMQKLRTTNQSYDPELGKSKERHCNGEADLHGNNAAFSKIPESVEVMTAINIGDEESKDLESDPEFDLVIVNHARRGCDVDSGRYYVSRKYRYLRNLPSFVIFSSICVTGTVVIWRSAHNPPAHHTVMPRANSLYMIMLISLVVGVTAEIFWRLSQNCNWGLPGRFFRISHLQSMEDPDGAKVVYGRAEDAESLSSSSSSTNEICISDNISSPLNLPHKSQIGNRASLTIRVESGRPFVSNVIRSVVDVTERPGIFMCGPEKLLSTIKKGICKERSRCGCGLSLASFYEEKFEM